MEANGNHSRISAANASWLIVVMIVAVPVFIFWPKSSPPPPTPPEVIPRTRPELTNVGLPNDPDLEGLPGFFAVWAGYAEWKDDKTIFAYRHPVSGEFSYFFEATRSPEGYRFRSVQDPRATQDLVLADDLAPTAVIRFVRPAATVAAGRKQVGAPTGEGFSVPPPDNVEVLLPDARGLRQIPPNPPPK